MGLTLKSILENIENFTSESGKKGYLGHFTPEEWESVYHIWRGYAHKMGMIKKKIRRIEKLSPSSREFMTERENIFSLWTDLDKAVRASMKKKRSTRLPESLEEIGGFLDNFFGG